MKFTLSDEPASRRKISGRVAKEGDSLAIYLDGFGNAEWPQGKGPIAVLMLQDGHLRLVTLPNFQSGEHSTLDLDGAKAP